MPGAAFCVAGASLRLRRRDSWSGTCPRAITRPVQIHPNPKDLLQECLRIIQECLTRSDKSVPHVQLVDILFFIGKVLAPLGCPPRELHSERIAIAG